MAGKAKRYIAANIILLAIVQSKVDCREVTDMAIRVLAVLCQTNASVYLFTIYREKESYRNLSYRNLNYSFEDFFKAILILHKGQMKVFTLLQSRATVPQR